MRLPFQTWRAWQTRKRMLAYAQFLADHSAQLDYEEYRPMRSFLTPYGHVPAYPTDCSESTSIIAHASGAPTPYVTGSWTRGFAGYTGTMLANLKHVPKVLARRGDFAVFVSPAEPNGQHVVMLMQSGWWRPDPIVWSHGEPGVNVWPLSEEARFHPGCSIVYLQSVPAYF